MGDRGPASRAAAGRRVPALPRRLELRGDRRRARHPPSEREKPRKSGARPPCGPDAGGGGDSMTHEQIEQGLRAELPADEARYVARPLPASVAEARAIVGNRMVSRPGVMVATAGLVAAGLVVAIVAWTALQAPSADGRWDRHRGSPIGHRPPVGLAGRHHRVPRDGLRRRQRSVGLGRGIARNRYRSSASSIRRRAARCPPSSLAGSPMPAVPSSSPAPLRRFRSRLRLLRAPSSSLACPGAIGAGAGAGRAAHARDPSRRE